MNLERLIFVPRYRNSWEASDLGWKLVARFWRPLMLSWLLLSLPLFIVFSLLETLAGPLAIYATLVIWWLKPVFERTQLYFLSLAVFDQAPTWKETLMRFPSYARFQILPSLLWRRLSPTRSFDLSVVQLEGLSGEPRSKRLTTLHRKADNAASWLTIILVHLETVLWFGLFALVMMFIPESVDMSWEKAWEEQIWLINGLYFLSVLVVAPFYVASGFMLYLNRRIELEGWDIELNFKEIVKTQEARPVKRSGSDTVNSLALVIMVSLVSIFTPVDSTYAQESRPVILSDLDEVPSCEAEACVYLKNIEQAQNDLSSVFEHEDFHQIESYKIPKWLDDLEFDQDNDAPSDSEMSPFMKSLIQFLSASIEVIIWAAFLCIVIYLIVRYRSFIAKVIDAAKYQRPETIELPKTMFGLDVRQEKLPADIEAEGLRLMSEGHFRECLSLLYRATIAALLHQYQIPFKAANTEQECLVISKSLVDESIYRFFKELTQTWKQLAYGHITPDKQALEQLCLTWNSVLGSRSDEDHQGEEQGEKSAKE